MRTLRAQTPYRTFTLFTAAQGLFGLAFSLIMEAVFPARHGSTPLLTVLAVAAFTLNGAVWGWLFFLADGQGLRR